MTPDFIILTGPTASGKSALSLAWAEALNGAVVNADSKQLYDGLRALSARPSAEDEARAPHHLYGVLQGDEAGEDAGSVGWWLRQVTQLFPQLWAENRLPIVVGGTGLYIRALLHGLSPIPAVPDAIRLQAQNRLMQDGIETFYHDLCQDDPSLIGWKEAQNPARLLRAREVLEATGRSIRDWQAQPATPPFPETNGRVVALLPEREWLYPRINQRVEAMVQQGAIEEVQALRKRHLSPNTPIMLAQGVRELGAYLDGTLSLPDAIAATQTATRRYAKRQYTWMRHQLPEAHVITRPDEGMDDLTLLRAQ